MTFAARAPAARRRRHRCDARDVDASRPRSTLVSGRRCGPSPSSPARRWGGPGRRTTRSATPTAWPGWPSSSRWRPPSIRSPRRRRASCRPSATPPTCTSRSTAMPPRAGERHPLHGHVGRHRRRARRQRGRGERRPTPPSGERLRAAVGLVDETVRRVDIQRSTSQTLLSLRQRLLRPLPSPRGLDLAARYRPTSRPLGMGGDWYDVVERRDGSVAIVIGDVVGHGIPAIATMIHVSTILGGLVRSAHRAGRHHRPGDGHARR